MKATKLDERFFDSTRGRIVTLLRGAKRTVNNLTEELGLTDNAVRAHLLSLERDGLVRQSGVQPGHRKPHFAYELTPDADRLFPKAYDLLLNQLLTVLKGQLAPKDLERILREVGRSLASGQTSAQSGDNLDSRMQIALEALKALGGAPRIEKEGDKLFIRSENCPLAAAVAEHPEVCRLAETLLAEITGASVTERCNREQAPRCNFEFGNTKSNLKDSNP